ncbi:hypothetical protein GDO81_002376 [Engystomops pustulosus]|uniref:Uncharacterized protein n=1 Tax=Engystomops pustulosus TaxID=76066 RepID=A0AAV7DJQ7_ENGPU|nr:hypothetical protein GDO81_002376 [Engystomops pustulosus]
MQWAGVPALYRNVMPSLLAKKLHQNYTITSCPRLCARALRPHRARSVKIGRDIEQMTTVHHSEICIVWHFCSSKKQGGISDWEWILSVQQIAIFF